MKACELTQKAKKDLREIAQFTEKCRGRSRAIYI